MAKAPVEVDGELLPEPVVPEPEPEPEPELPLVPELLVLALLDEPLPHAVQKSASVRATVALLTRASERGTWPVADARDADGGRCMRVSPHARMGALARRHRAFRCSMRREPILSWYERVRGMNRHRIVSFRQTLAFLFKRASDSVRMRQCCR